MNKILIETVNLRKTYQHFNGNITLFNNLNLKIKWVGNGIKECAVNKQNKKIIVKINPKFFRPSEVNYLRGNFSKAKRILKWKPKNNIKSLIKIMIDAELKRLKNI